MDNQLAQDITKKSFFKRLLNPKLIFLVIGLVILGEVIYAVKTLRKPVPAPQTTQIKSMTGGKIELTSIKKNYQVGENVPVVVNISTGGHQTDGTDAIIHFDPRVLEASKSAIIKSKIYNDYPQLQVDQKAGVVRISAITSINQKGFTGKGILARINFKAKKIGKANIFLEFQKNQTSESNIIESKTTMDILEAVQNLSLTIQ